MLLLDYHLLQHRSSILSNLRTFGKHKRNDRYPEMDPVSFASSCSTSPGSRRCDSAVEDEVAIRTHTPRDSATILGVSASPDVDDTGNVTSWSTKRQIVTPHHRHSRCLDDRNTTQKIRSTLTEEQDGLLQKWYQDFARPDIVPAVSEEHMVAFAKAIQIDQYVVIDYVGQRRDNKHAKERDTDLRQHDQASARSIEEPYALTKANNHLSPSILPIVDRYVSTCRRRRSQNDGRRSVNTGPYRCTFGCGYRTKRAFDWRRHEETHEPQELWLCMICRQNDVHNSFLVNRKDKFLKHVTDKHAELAAETVLEKSKLDFVPRAELGCRHCGEESASWDERCRHVLGHFEDKVERSMKRVKIVHEERVDLGADGLRDVVVEDSQ